MRKTQEMLLLISKSNLKLQMSMLNRIQVTVMIEEC